MPDHVLRPAQRHVCLYLTPTVLEEHMIRAKPHLRLRARHREAIEWAHLSITGRGPIVLEWAVSTEPGFCAQWHTYWRASSANALADARRYQKENT